MNKNYIKIKLFFMAISLAQPKWLPTPPNPIISVFLARKHWS